MSRYEFFTRWELTATPEEVYRILEDVHALTTWWPSVYLKVAVVEEGNAEGIGKRVDLYTKGWLPYTLRWQFVVTKADFPHGFSLQAIGDFKGSGVWHFSALDADSCEVTYDWRISAEKPLLKYLSFLLRPIFAANHHWAMRQGEISLRLELLRRRLNDEAAQKMIPAPPGPTFVKKRPASK